MYTFKYVEKIFWNSICAYFYMDYFSRRAELFLEILQKIIARNVYQNVQFFENFWENIRYILLRRCSRFRWDRKHLLYHRRTRLSLITIFHEARCTYAMHLRQDEIISTAKSILGSDNTDLIAIEPSNLQSWLLI